MPTFQKPRGDFGRMRKGAKSSISIVRQSSAGAISAWIESFLFAEVADATLDRIYCCARHSSRVEEVLESRIVSEWAPSLENGGDDGTRTRGLCRDRAAF
jgi:hypothetical protein